MEGEREGEVELRRERLGLRLGPKLRKLKVRDRRGEGEGRVPRRRRVEEEKEYLERGKKYT